MKIDDRSSCAVYLAATDIVDLQSMVIEHIAV